METILKRLEFLSSIGVFLLLICFLQTLGLCFIVVESSKTLDRADIAVSRLEKLDANLDVIEHKIDKVNKITSLQ
ncbi:hypothetical protein HHE02_12200 [Helicobacter heilmannii]|uniref:Uncharacterized protein n=1 Tax=Helicobacter heilmannii TaxID=35817 RepID=A0A0K2Y5Q9_HELHE|nr:hypothetical protein [Helicobacter heilmannii]CCM12349.1 hypothetical protein BN341_8100 [Helicobacter heilmannii ASB1.4]CRF46498.1 hypothetical protein HHE014_15090 [Helicobacter heilmannii]CRF47919.1 hypothetical protein HHE02_12200 [Helicobacter heilmannii]CRF48792.1 hypothetical protein HHE03_03690 [Helicobacter heilmannii]CRI34506.1 hypothetical protein HHE01_13520 [Helicobacter heilmannii]